MQGCGGEWEGVGVTSLFISYFKAEFKPKKRKKKLKGDEIRAVKSQLHIWEVDLFYTRACWLICYVGLLNTHIRYSQPRQTKQGLKGQYEMCCSEIRHKSNNTNQTTDSPPPAHPISPLHTKHLFSVSIFPQPGMLVLHKPLFLLPIDP